MYADPKFFFKEGVIVFTGGGAGVGIPRLFSVIYDM